MSAVRSNFRNSLVRRKGIAATTQVKVWARAAGRCVLCAKSVLDSRSFFHTVLVGQMAHNVGAQGNEASPRGQSDLKESERNKESNLLLTCPDCHRMIDSPENLGLFTRERLEALKFEHESRVAKATSFETLRRTLVVTTNAQVRGTNSKVSDREIAEAMISAGLVMHVNDGIPVRVDIRLDDEEEDEWVWVRGRQKIDSAVNRLKHEAEIGGVDHISVFALAPISLLVYLGSQLDDKLTVGSFDRNRVGTRDAWSWSSAIEPTPEFSVRAESAIPNSEETDVVAYISVSGTVSADRLPSSLVGAPSLTLTTAGMVPKRGIIDTQAALDAAGESWTLLLATIEERWPKTQRIHLFAAVPASFAIRMGQTRLRNVHPALVVYQRDKFGCYVATPEIGDT